MPWYDYLAAFFAGAFLANTVPHYVKGVCGDAFPTPFSKPPGIGLSSPVVNVWWALFNLIVGFLLFRAGQIATGGWAPVLLFFAGFAALSTQVSLHFVNKHNN